MRLIQGQAYHDIKLQQHRLFILPKGRVRDSVHIISLKEIKSNLYFIYAQEQMSII